MFDWLQSKSAPLRPLPLSQREKSYSSALGVVYTYLFLGLQGTRHVFEVGAGRNPRFQLFVQILPDAHAAAEEKMLSPLRWNEEYALAKLGLFEAFDTLPISGGQTIQLSSDHVMRYMTELNMA